MTNSNDQLQMLATITSLVEKAPGEFGRTALMKCLFFLDVLRNVPLPYNFRLYTYGPFDGEVLGDLSYAESLGAIKSSVVSYPRGYGYEFNVGPEASKIVGMASEFVANHQSDIDWVIKEFGHRSASNLEMASTLVYVDRTLAKKNSIASISELAEKVHDVKPHLKRISIENEAKDLRERGYLQAAK